MANGGEVTIQIKAKTDKFDKQIAEIEKKGEKLENKKIVIEAKLDTQQQDLEKTRQKTDELGDAYQRLKELKEKASKTPVEFSELQGLENQYGTLGKIENELDKTINKQVELEGKVAQTQLQYDGINKEITEYSNKINAIKLEKQQADVQKLKDGFGQVGNSVEKTIKKVGRLALGIFGIRSAYLMLRRASSDLAGYDDQYATNLEYIRFVLTQAIAPVLRGIVDLAMKLLQIVGMVVKALFGVNIFASGSAEQFNKMKKGAGGVGKAVKEIKKQLAGFDEINVLTDQSDTGTSAGAGGVGMPSIDIAQGEPPEWIKWLAENKDLILALLSGLVAGLLAAKLQLGAIKSLGIGVAVAGIVYAIQSIIDYIQDPSWKNFGKIIEGIGIAIAGLGIIMKDWKLGVAGLIVAVVGLIVENWEQIKAFFQNGIDWLKYKVDWVYKVFGNGAGAIFEVAIDLAQRLLNVFDSLFTAVKGILDGIIQLIRGVFTGNWEQAWQGAKTIFSNIWSGITGILKNGLMGILDLISIIGATAGDILASAFKGVVNGVLGAIETILNSPIKAINSLINTINTVPGINLKKLSTFKLPRLAVGGIVNMPNKGTMIGGAIAGESRTRTVSFL